MRKQLTVNGRAADVEIEPLESLLDVLRQRLRLTGAKEACGRGECGACTVLLDGTPVMACVTLASLVRGDVTTIEGLADETRDLREAFADAGAFQCGYCTPGQIVTAAALLRVGTPSGEPAVRSAMSGNICRCTGYTQIVDAVLSTARRRAAAHRPVGVAAAAEDRTP